ncbi:MAG: ammonia-forming cytochrome c nitrite reductase subunit c552 [Bryobacterales bacterium]|nr:ammonia-forming cytochrome c nitrite reductase subunit c552 [Bryobacterales bacterium]
MNRACQGCHHFSETEMKDRDRQIQTRFMKRATRPMDALIDLIDRVKGEGQEAGATDDQLKAWCRTAQGQFFIDLVEAENSVGFHAPGEELRVLTRALDAIRKGRMSLRSRVYKVAAKAGKQAD